MNAASGSRDAIEQRETIESVLREAKQRYEILAVDDPAKLTSVARDAATRARQHTGAVVVAGGDGTINAVAQEVLPTNRPFGIIPQGTFNYSGRAHDIPLETEAAARALLDATLKPVQVGLLTGRIFLVNASVGIYPELLQDREAWKQQYGRNRLVALWAGIMTLLKDHRQLALRIQHDEHEESVLTPSIFVGNNQLQLEQIGLPESEALERRRLAAVIVKPIGTAALLGLAMRGALRQLGEAENVRDFSFRQMRVTLAQRTDGTIQVATDGEIWRAKLPLEFEVAPLSLHLMTSPSAESS